MPLPSYCVAIALAFPAGMQHDVTACVLAFVWRSCFWRQGRLASGPANAASHLPQTAKSTRSKLREPTEPPSVGLLACVLCIPSTQPCSSASPRHVLVFLIGSTSCAGNFLSERYAIVPQNAKPTGASKPARPAKIERLLGCLRRHLLILCSDLKFLYLFIGSH